MATAAQGIHWAYMLEVDIQAKILVLKDNYWVAEGN